MVDCSHNEQLPARCDVALRWYQPGNRRQRAEWATVRAFHARSSIGDRREGAERTVLVSNIRLGVLDICQAAM